MEADSDLLMKRWRTGALEAALSSVGYLFIINLVKYQDHKISYLGKSSKNVNKFQKIE